MSQTWRIVCIEKICKMHSLHASVDNYPVSFAVITMDKCITSLPRSCDSSNKLGVLRRISSWADLAFWETKDVLGRVAQTSLFFPCNDLEIMLKLYIVWSDIRHFFDFLTKEGMLQTKSSTSNWKLSRVPVADRLSRSGYSRRWDVIDNITQLAPIQPKNIPLQP